MVQYWLKTRSCSVRHSLHVDVSEMFHNARCSFELKGLCLPILHVTCTLNRVFGGCQHLMKCTNVIISVLTYAICVQHQQRWTIWRQTTIENGHAPLSCSLLKTLQQICSSLDKNKSSLAFRRSNNLHTWTFPCMERHYYDHHANSLHHIFLAVFQTKMTESILEEFTTKHHTDFHKGHVSLYVNT